MSPSGARLRSGITGLDAMLGGGLLPRTVAIARGAPGTGKTTLGMQFVLTGILEHGEPGLIVTFEEFPEDLYRDAASFGWDLRAHEAAGQLTVVFTSPETLLDDLQAVDSPLMGQIAARGVRRVLIDSVSHYREIERDPVQLRRVYRVLVNSLKREGLTAILTQEEAEWAGQPSHEMDGLAFLCDTILLLRYVEIESAIRRALLVLKMRGSAHDQEIRQYRIAAHGLEVETKFAGQENILSGAPRRSLSDRALRLFG